MELVTLGLVYLGIPAVLYFLYACFVRCEDRRIERKRASAVKRHFWNPYWLEVGCLNQIFAGFLRWVIALVVWGGLITAILYFLFGISVFGLLGS